MYFVNWHKAFYAIITSYYNIISMDYWEAAKLMSFLYMVINLNDCLL